MPESRGYRNQSTQETEPLTKIRRVSYCIEKEFEEVSYCIKKEFEKFPFA